MASIFRQIDRPIDSFHFLTSPSVRAGRPGRFRHHFHFSPSQLLSLSPTTYIHPLLSLPLPIWPFYDASRVQLLPHPHTEFPLSGSRVLILSPPTLSLVPPFVGCIERYYAVETICQRECPVPFADSESERKRKEEGTRTAGGKKEGRGKGWKEKGLTNELREMSQFWQREG